MFMDISQIKRLTFRKLEIFVSRFLRFLRSPVKGGGGHINFDDLLFGLPIFLKFFAARIDLKSS